MDVTLIVPAKVDSRLVHFASRAYQTDLIAAVHETLAYTLRKQQFWIGAIASLREAIRLDSKRAITHLNLGFALSHEGDLDGAISSYLKALSVDKNFVEAHKQLAVCRDKKGDSEGAIASLHEVIRLEPKNASAHTRVSLQSGPAIYRIDPSFACKSISVAIL